MIRVRLATYSVLGFLLFPSTARADLAPDGPSAFAVAMPLVGLLVLVGVILLLLKRRRKS
jgi:LPXTG-motif cell wall-anchored protein